MWITLIAIILGTFVAVLNNSLINIALPTLVNVFGSTTQTIQWVLTGFMLASAVVIPMSGALGDKFGYKKVYLTTLIAFTITSGLCGLAWSDSSLIAFRIVQGVSGGMIMPIGMAMIYMIIPREKIGVALGLYGIAAMVAPAVGPTLSGYLIEYFSWRMLFFMNVPVGIIAVFLCSILLKETPKKPDMTFDLLGAVLSVIAFGTLLLALSKGQAEGWTSLYIVSLFFIAFFSMALFIWVELGKEQPLLDLRLFKIPVFTLSVFTSSFVMIGMMGGVFLIPIFLQNIQGMTAVDTGLLLMPQSVAMALMMPVSGKLFDKYGVGPVGFIGLTIMGITTLALYRLTADTPHHWLDTVLTLRGLGIGLCMMPLSTVGMNAVPRASVGKASSLSNVIRQVMSSLGIAILTGIMTRQQNLHTAAISESVSIMSDAANDVLKSLSGVLSLNGVDQAAAFGTASYLLAGLIQREAAVRAIADTLMLSALPVVASIPLVYFLRKKNAGAKPEQEQKTAA
ncbi:DHA2 family efflux MFS transporter permease subunit [Brevibacillus sp. H7]|uniref:DHA2 family efflux MFS transporter permease subunit n=1 Tax=Brevibacillus sp. H7 TaxID=3349138 RepID=UPI00382D95E7